MSSLDTQAVCSTLVYPRYTRAELSNLARAARLFQAILRETEHHVVDAARPALRLARKDMESVIARLYTAPE